MVEKLIDVTNVGYRVRRDRLFVDCFYIHSSEPRLTRDFIDLQTPLTFNVPQAHRMPFLRLRLASHISYVSGNSSYLGGHVKLDHSPERPRIPSIFRSVM